jgi:hypothetical protein
MILELDDELPGHTILRPRRSDGAATVGF